MRPLLDRLLDRSIALSYDRSGFLRHQSSFVDSDLDTSMQGKVCLVTGANSGLGLATARGLAERGATVHLLCRNASRGAAARRQIQSETGNSEVHLDLIDLSSLQSVRDFAGAHCTPNVDVLVHNAGVLPDRRELSADGIELTVATHLVGPFLLTALLRPRLRRARVVFVSSGGMYAKRLDLDAMIEERGGYSGVAAYAMTKRAQVVLSEQWAGALAGTGTVVNAMHPGWANTKAVEQSLPRFWQVMRHRLRSPEEGADSVLWLAVAERVAHETGKFWFDRQAVSPHLCPWTRESPEERRRLWDFCAWRAGCSEEKTGAPHYWSAPARSRL